MPITHVINYSFTNSGASIGRVVTTSSVQTGDLLLAGVQRIGTSAITLPAGWAHVTGSPTAGLAPAMFAWKFAAAGDISATIDFTQAGTGGFVVVGSATLAAFRSSLGFRSNPFSEIDFRNDDVNSWSNIGPVTGAEDTTRVVVFEVCEASTCPAEEYQTGTWTVIINGPSGTSSSNRAEYRHKSIDSGVSSGYARYRVTLGSIPQTRTHSQWMVALTEVIPASGTTLSKLQTGGGVYAYVLAIEGYDKLITTWPDTSAITAAWSSTDWADALSGLLIETQFDQEIRPLDPRLDFGSAQFTILDGETDDFGQAVASQFKNTGKSGNLASTASPSATTLTLQDTGDLPTSGSAWIGTEAVTYTGKTSTTLTGVVRGVYAPFTIDSGAGMARRHAVSTIAGVATFRPIVSDFKRVWIGSRLGLWIHKVEDGVLNAKSDALLLFAGEITDVADDGDGATRITATDIRESVGEYTLLSEQFTVGPVEGIYLLDSDYFRLAARFSSYEVIQIGSASLFGGNDEFLTPQRWTASQLMDAVNEALETLAPTASFVCQIRPNGIAKFVVGVTGAETLSMAVAMSARVATLLGFDEETATRTDETGDEDLYVWVSEIKTQTNPVVGIRGSYPYAEYATSFNFRSLQTLELAQGTWVNQADDMPLTIRRTFGTEGGDWGFLQITEGYVALVERTTDTSFKFFDDELVNQLFSQESLLSADRGRFPAVTRFGEPAPRYKQVVCLEGDFDVVIPKMIASTGTAAYNEATYDDYSSQLGAGIPWELLGDAFIESVRSIGEIANETMTVMLDEPTKLSEILIPELAMRNAHIVFKDGIRFKRIGGGVPIESADHTITDSNLAATLGDALTVRPSARWSKDFVINVLKLEYDRDFKGDFHAVKEIQNPTSITEYGSSPVTIRARSIVTRGRRHYEDAIQEILEQLGADILATYDEPLQFVTLPLSGDKIVAMAPGDTVALSSSWIRYHGDGARGVTNVLGYITQTSFDLGALDGTITIALTGDELARTAIFSPAASVDETVSTGTYVSGYDSANNNLTVKAHAYSLSSDPADASRFAIGDSIRVIERSPANTAAPQQWAVDVTNVSGNVITISAALTGWSGALEYYVTADEYSAVEATQATAAFFADDADDFIAGAERSRTYRSTPTGDSLLDFAGDPDALYQFPALDGLWYNEGRPLHPVIYRTLAGNMNNFVSHRMSVEMPMAQDEKSTTELAFQLAWFPMYIPVGHAGRSRSLRIGPRLRASAGTATLRATVSNQMPRSNFVGFETVSFDLQTSRSVSFTTGSTTYVNVATQDVEIPFDGLGGFWLTLEFKATVASETFCEGLHALSVGSV